VIERVSAPGQEAERPVSERVGERATSGQAGPAFLAAAGRSTWGLGPEAERPVSERVVERATSGQAGPAFLAAAGRSTWGLGPEAERR